MDPLAVLNGLQAAIALAREAKSNTDLREALANAREHALDLREKLQEQQEELVSLRALVALREDLTFDRDMSVYRDPAGDPFCAKCLDGVQKACRMHETSQSFQCITCDRKIFKPGYPKPPKPRPRHGRSWLTEF